MLLLGVSFGGLMTMSSYNEFNNNIFRDTMIVSLGNCFSSVFAGFGVFSFLGHMAYKNCMSIDKVVASGPGNNDATILDTCTKCI